jgi:ketosteroid isomerase-like protein
MVYYREAIHQHVQQLGTRWAYAELHGDADALAELLAQDFFFVGPRGTVIDRDRYLYARFSGDLKHQSFIWRDVHVSLYGGAAVTIGRLTQRSTFRGNDASGDFRVTQIAVEQGRTWKLAGLHLSPILQRSHGS